LGSVFIRGISTVEVNGSTLTICLTHPLPPISGTYAEFRNKHLIRLAKFSQRAPDRFIIVGDLNTTNWNYWFNRVLEDGDLNDSMVGSGLQSTWPTFSKSLAIPLDHFLYKSGVHVLSRSVKGNCGSDHASLSIEFEILTLN